MKPDRDPNARPATVNGAETPEDGMKTPEDNETMGLALRAVYQKAVEEEIPASMLDLLGKLS